VVRDHAHRTDTNLPIDPRARCFAVVVYWRQVYSSSDGVKKGPGCGSVEAAICCQPSACLLMADGRWQMAQTNPRALSNERRTGGAHRAHLQVRHQASGAPAARQVQSLSPVEPG